MTETATRSDLDVRLEIYRKMQEGRLFEKRAHDLFLEGLVKGTSHLGLGQEAVAAGFAAALRAEGPRVLHVPRPRPHAAARRADGRADGRAARPSDRHLRRQGRLDAPDRRRARRDGLVRDRRRAHADRGRRGVGGEGARHRPGRRLLLRRRDDEHRGVPRGAEPGRRLEAAGRVRLREQPLHGVHADRRRDRRRAPGGRPGGRVRARVDPGRRQRRRRGARDRRSRWSTGRAPARARRWSRP